MEAIRISYVALVAALLGSVVTLETGCNDATAPTPTGAIGITTTTTGADLDGYRVTVDGGGGLAIGTNGTLTIWHRKRTNFEWRTSVRRR